ncbi:MAG: ABC transporter ATP-binding protein [Hyphomicrobiales bacterium]|nr:MAG: ABC transporter ATP-binding protein [Hyphomicrobiales bacterium]
MSKTMAKPAPQVAAEDRGGPLQPLLIVEGLTKHFNIRSGLAGRVTGKVHAVDGVSFSVGKGEVLGVVGESGCGKSTTARLLMHLIPSDHGNLVFDGDPIGGAGMSVAQLRRNMQMVFQDSHASLNPRMTIADCIGFAPRMHGMKAAAVSAKVHELLDLVGLEARLFANRYPHELSGGQRQRVNIARALALEPRLLILDESVSALDKSVEAQILNLLQSLKERLNLTYIFISHDLNVIEFVSDRILVMYLGQVVESGPVDQVYGAPRHPYTRALLSSKPSLDPRRRTLEPPITGDPPNPINPPSGCRFRTRCGFAEDVCAAGQPALGASGTAAPDHVAACFMYQPGSGHSRALQ